MSVVNDANRELWISKIAIVASCSEETVRRLCRDVSQDDLVLFESELKDGKKAIRYGKIVEL